MGLSIHDLEDVPQQGRSKRMRISQNRYRFMSPNSTAGPNSDSNSSPDSYQHPIAGTTPSMVESLNILRRRLNVIRERQHILQAEEVEALPMVRAGRSSLTSNISARSDRAAGRLRRLPSVHFGELHRHSSFTDFEGTNDTVRFRPPHLSNAQFIVRDSDDIDDNLWTDTNSADSTLEVQRRREIIRELGLRLQEARRRIFGPQDALREHDAFLREFGEKEPTELHDVGTVGEDAYKVTSQRLRSMNNASIEKFGTVLPSGVLWETEDLPTREVNLTTPVVAEQPQARTQPDKKSDEVDKTEFDIASIISDNCNVD